VKSNYEEVEEQQYPVARLSVKRGKDLSDFEKTYVQAVLEGLNVQTIGLYY